MNHIARYRRRKISTLFGLLFSSPLVRDNKAQGVWRFLKWRLLLALNEKVVFPYVNESKLVLSRDIKGVNFTCYVGLAEFESMGFLLHFLREDDFFIDIGAYIGVYTVLASAVIKARTLAVEPITHIFSRLLENIHENGIEGRVKALNIGLGESNGSLYFTSLLDTRNHVIKNGENSNNSVEVQTRRLDDLAISDSPVLIKIDVEGYVTPILKGAEDVLKKNTLKALIVEIWKKQIPVKLLINNGFRPYKYDPFLRELSVCDCTGRNDVIFLRDVEFVKNRLKEAPKFNILNRHI